jgi:predicted ribosome quality control (RQC) complex YloA/Tae2 family protein
MQTSLHITTLAAELQKTIVGGVITGADFFRKQRAAYFSFKRDKLRSTLGFVYHPAGYGVFLAPSSKVRIDTPEKPRPIFVLEGSIVREVGQVGFDRIFQVLVDKDGCLFSIVFEALGPNGNIWLLDQNDAKLSALRQRSFTAGEKYQPPPLPDRLNPLELDTASLKNFRQLKDVEAQSILTFLEKNILGFNATLAKEVVTQAGLSAEEKLRDLDDHAVAQLCNGVKEISGRFVKPGTGYLYRIGGAVEAYPFRLQSIEQKPQKFATLSLAVQAMIELRRQLTASIDKEKRLKNAVSNVLKRLEIRRAKIERDIEEASDYERYRKMGELLQINFDRLKKGMESITLEDVYSESHEAVTIPLDPALSPAENIDAYFKKHRKGRQALRLLQRRLTVTQDELKRWSVIQSELERDFDSARDRYAGELSALLPPEGTKQQSQPRLPYREFTLSTGVKIFVGRGGADNDRTTFEYAKPYELWFHTQQCPGSHVVMKFPNKSYEPLKREIEEAASVAAYFSKAKNDSLVPVIYTQRKYVRKPRKAKAGLVTVEREKSVMVVPRKPQQSANQPNE